MGDYFFLDFSKYIILNTAKVARNKETSKEKQNINKTLTFIVEADSGKLCTFAAVGIQWGRLTLVGLVCYWAAYWIPFLCCNNGFLWLYPLGGGRIIHLWQIKAAKGRLKEDLSRMGEKVGRAVAGG